uniref:Uncharacterized protein n=1 Tax=Cacopsylla melanoneura TaxID=428564 RepID=A0A8D8QT30_9HEMI
MTMLSLLVDEYYAQEKKELILKIKKKCSTIKDSSILGDDFVLQVIQFIVMNPTNGLLKVDQESLGRLIDLSTAFIQDEYSPLMTTLKMRKQFRKMFKQKDWTAEEVSFKFPYLIALYILPDLSIGIFRVGHVKTSLLSLAF